MVTYYIISHFFVYVQNNKNENKNKNKIENEIKEK